MCLAKGLNIQFVRKDLGLIPGVHTVVTNHVSHYSSKGPNAFFWPLWVPGMWCRHTCSQNMINIKCFEKEKEKKLRPKEKNR